MSESGNSGLFKNARDRDITILITFATVIALVVTQVPQTELESGHWVCDYWTSEGGYSAMNAPSLWDGQTSQICDVSEDREVVTCNEGTENEYRLFCSGKIWKIGASEGIGEILK